MQIDLAIDAVGRDPVNDRFIVMLRESDGERFLSIPIGRHELYALVFAIEGGASARPQTHALMLDLIASGGMTPVAVRIGYWQKGFFRASLVLEREGVPVEIDARASDGLILAVRAGIGIYCDPSTMRDFGMRETGASLEPTRLEELEVADFGDFIM